MTTVTLQKNIFRAVKTLSPDRLVAALEFLNFLKEKDEERNATTEVLSDQALYRDIQIARRAWAKGAAAQFTPWRKIKRNV